MKFTLYHMGHCPYCKRVISTVKQLNISMEYKDLDVHDKFSKELVSGGGKRQVPCLLIRQTGVSDQWLYESQDIIDYLHQYNDGEK